MAQKYFGNFVRMTKFCFKFIDTYCIAVLFCKRIYIGSQLL